MQVDRRDLSHTNHRKTTSDGFCPGAEFYDDQKPTSTARVACAASIALRECLTEKFSRSSGSPSKKTIRTMTAGLIITLTVFDCGGSLRGRNKAFTKKAFVSSAILQVAFVVAMPDESQNGSWCRTRDDEVEVHATVVILITGKDRSRQDGSVAIRESSQVQGCLTQPISSLISHCGCEVSGIDAAWISSDEGK